jgi:hypothetical protein
MQLIGHYYATRVLVIGNSFYSLWIILRIFIPLAVAVLLSIPMSEIGLGLPQKDTAVMRLFLIGIVGVSLTFCGIYFIKDYVQHYATSFMGDDGSRLSRFVDFSIFTASTLLAWEFFHRGFLLSGIRYLLVNKEKVDEKSAILIAVLTVWVFEVIFHFIKPMVEPLGLLIGSPLLSFVAIRTKSIWLSFAAHLYVELLFIAVVIFQ